MTCGRYDIGFEKALSMTLEHLAPLQPVDMPVQDVSGLVAAQDCRAAVDCPSAASSLKDGYAVISADVADASRDHPVRLKKFGVSSAGNDADAVVIPGRTVQVMTGAVIPAGTEAVVPEEFTREENLHVVFYRGAMPGKNILSRGSDVAKGDSVAARGDILTPALTGLLAAAGIHRVRVYPRPQVGIISTGDEVVAPGRRLKSGQLYASNLVTLVSWLKHFKFKAMAEVVPDRKDKIRDAVEDMLLKADVLLTSGGTWKSERDFTTGVLTDMGGKIVFHRVRLGPGKAVALILVNEKAVFSLPGGPPSNEMAFLQIALPGLLHMTARPPVPFSFKTARLSAPVGGKISWTQFFQAGLEKRGRQWLAHPLRMKSRLQSQAAADAIIKVPEGVEQLNAGDEVEVQDLGFLTSTCKRPCHGLRSRVF